MENVLELKNVTKAYDGFMLHDINIILPKGCIMGFIGENGAGKSTTIKLILNLIHRDSGEIKVFGKENIANNLEIKEDIGVVFDESNFPDTMNASDVNVVMKNIYKKWDAPAFFSYLTRFSLPLKKSIKEYSRGMKMKLSIAAALSHHAKLLILDEATSGLDPVVRDEILDVFLEFIQDEEHAVFISSHITSDLEKAADYITLIHNGQILFSESKDELLDEYGVLKCSAADYESIDKEIVFGCRKNTFGVEALIKRKALRGDYIVDSASIEDIMLFRIKGEVK